MEGFNPKEERLNAITHGIGIVSGILGLVLLLTHNAHRTPYSTPAILVYGVSIILLFTASTMYHGIDHGPLKKKFRILDHICIYYLIAGTYTPVTLITLINGHGWLIFCLVWGVALAGTLLKLFFTGKYETLSLLLYLVMGWLIIFDLGALLQKTSVPGMQLLAAGGAFYTFGTLFYAIRRIPYNHLIWHLFVLAGAISHWFFIYLEVI